MIGMVGFLCVSGVFQCPPHGRVFRTFTGCIVITTVGFQNVDQPREAPRIHELPLLTPAVTSPTNQWAFCARRSFTILGASVGGIHTCPMSTDVQLVFHAVPAGRDPYILEMLTKENSS